MPKNIFKKSKMQKLEFGQHYSTFIGRSQVACIKSSIPLILFVAAALRRKVSELGKYVETYRFINLDLDLKLGISY